MIVVDTTDLRVCVSIDAEKSVILIDDDGIDVDKTELTVDLGTMAKSGTSDFLAKLEQTVDKTPIGQFCVELYSAFLVADHVTGIRGRRGRRRRTSGRARAAGTSFVRRLRTRSAKSRARRLFFT